MRLRLPRVLALLTAVSTVLAGMSLEAVADDSRGAAFIGPPVADTDDAASLPNAFTEAERQEEEVGNDLDLIADRAADIGLLVHRFGRAAIAGAGSASRPDRAMLPIRGPPAT